MVPLTISLLLLFLILLSAFFSASETAIIGLSKIRLRNLVNKGKKHAKSISRLTTKLDKFIAAILIGNDFVNIAISAIVTAIMVGIFGPRWGVIISTFSATFFILILCEITPKIFAVQRAEKVSLFSAPLMELFIKIFSPVIRVFTGTSNLILRIFGGAPQKRSPLITEEELRLMIEVGKEEGVLTDEERRMLHRIFEFGDTLIEEVMVPKERIIAVDIRANTEELLNVLVEKGHSRIPIYEGSIENIIGIIYARDLLYIWRDDKLVLLPDLVHPAYYIPPRKRVNELLREFQKMRLQIAIVADEKKNTLGLVTLEDLLEEIVGEIEESVDR